MPRRIEVKDGDHTVATAEVAVSGQDDGTIRASLHAVSGHIAPGRRASLADAVMELPEAQAGARLEAAVPAGDAESIARAHLARGEAYGPADLRPNRASSGQ